MGPSARAAPWRSMSTTGRAKRGSRRSSVATRSWPAVLRAGNGSAGRAGWPPLVDAARRISSAAGDSHVTGLLLGSQPVLRIAREHGLAPRRLRGAFQRVGRRAPLRVVRRRPVRLQRRLVLVDLVEVVRVGVGGIFKDVETAAAGLVALGAERVR